VAGPGGVFTSGLSAGGGDVVGSVAAGGVLGSMNTAVGDGMTGVSLAAAGGDSAPVGSSAAAGGDGWLGLSPLAVRGLIGLNPCAVGGPRMSGRSFCLGQRVCAGNEGSSFESSGPVLSGWTSSTTSESRGVAGARGVGSEGSSNGVTSSVCSTDGSSCGKMVCSGPSIGGDTRGDCRCGSELAFRRLHASIPTNTTTVTANTANTMSHMAKRCCSSLLCWALSN